MTEHQYTTPAEALVAYSTWLERQPLSANSRRTYRARLRGYCDYLAGGPPEYGDPLRERHSRDYAVRDYKTHLKTVRKAKPTSVNLSLAAIDSFYGFLGLGRPDVRREDLPGQAPRALSPEAQKRFLRAVERSPEARDRALAPLLFYTALRLGRVCRARYRGRGGICPQGQGGRALGQGRYLPGGEPERRR